MLSGKKIILGVTGCIAAYKSVELLRLLQKAGADVWVVMTDSAQEFVTPLTFRTLSGNPVITKMFDKDISSMPLPHISLSDNADLLLVVPATANIIAKAAYGIADDVLSTLFLSCECPKAMAPAMNTKMWNNATVRSNISKLKKEGIKFISPVEGDLACGTKGQGHLADINGIFDLVTKMIGKKQDLAGKKVLVTAGGTKEAIDPVRFISNRSSGKMGMAIAKEAAERGAEVTLIKAGERVQEAGHRVIQVATAAEMKKAVEQEFQKNDFLVMAAAVSDYRPAKVSTQKIKKNEAKLMIELERTEDILSSVTRNKGRRTVIGFALETEDLLANARKKLKEKGLDLIVANDPSAFEGDESSVSIISRTGKAEKLPRMKKADIAAKIIDLLS